ncbi:MAG: undecaprenyl/decaprenyl-phosphate alpha-N-acetylglucosaminyl 1-phosphate transferase [Phycisphaerales bacterium]|nr:undecaprenyl/decaprenyl-phosphate alpha-N-acetylglucosaminyl 1-phosphate transferase [Phycisphaerales bacterium]
MNTPAAEAIVGNATVWTLLVDYLPVFVLSFLVVLFITPLFRQLALASKVIDLPDDARKVHHRAIPYLGGMAVFMGLLVGIAISYVLVAGEPAAYRPLPVSIVGGMIAIAFTGLADDVWGWDPRLKIAGQLVAAALLALNDIGTRVAAGLLDYLFGLSVLEFTVPTPVVDIPVNVTEWIGTAIIAIFVLGGCNAANLVDGLDGLLSGTVAIIAVGLLALSLLMASHLTEGDVAHLTTLLPDGVSGNEGVTLSGARIVLSLALLGAVLGFLPHNFNPATIFLGDCGSLLLGYCCVVVILMLGEQGETHLVLAGLLIFGVPIVDTILAIFRRKVQGLRMSDPDAKHLHHVLKAWLGGVKRAVLAVYGLELVLASLGVAVAAMVLLGDLRVLVVYLVFIGVYGSVVVIGIRMGLVQKRQSLKGAS